ncbi:hypothetical protein [Paraburkholderia ribeironis]|uniref:hypothetical protein n=1 Tax=Paraburkholderia ribeironis TaxID=1247936 RepID=UPI0011782AB7|nr:hypothetical protein [Paraburkholderia ribeironis]
MVDIKGNFRVANVSIFISHYENEFRNANVLASHKGGSYNRFIGCSSSATSAVSSTSSFGGLNPNRSFGFFFVRKVQLALCAGQIDGAVALNSRTF